MKRNNLSTELSYAAHRWHLSLCLGLASVADVVKWADEMILKLPEPPDALLNLSMISTDALTQDVARMLEPLMHDPRLIEPLRPLLGVIARQLQQKQLEVHVVIQRLAYYGVDDNSGSRWLPPDMALWLDDLFYECLNAHYVYPSRELLQQGMRDLISDLTVGLESLSATGQYQYAIRAAVKRAKEARDAEVQPIPRTPAVSGMDKMTGLRRLTRWLFGN